MTARELNGHLREALPVVNLVGLATTVAVLWWRTAVLEQTTGALTAAVVELRVEVAVLHQVSGRP